MDDRDGEGHDGEWPDGGGIAAVGPGDRWAAAELLARYAELVDAGDFDGVGRLLGDAVLSDADGRRIAAGAAEVAALYAGTTRRHDDGTPGTAHVITNVIVDAVPGDADRLQVRSRFTVFQAVDDLPLQPVVIGRYVDTLRRHADGWRFAERRMVPERWGDVSHHLTFDPRG